MRRAQSQVSNWMSENPITVLPEATLVEAYELMQDHDIRRLLVVRRTELLGIVTKSDLLRASSAMSEDDDVKRRMSMTGRRVADVMTYDPVTIDPEDSIQDAAERMLEYQVSGLPVLSGNKPVGIITESDIFRLVVESWSSELVAEE
jgi:acetoin utilization protein AcuB